LSWAAQATLTDAFGSGTEGVIAKIEAFAHQEFNNDGAMLVSAAACLRSNSHAMLGFKSTEAIAKVTFNRKRFAALYAQS
jgi:hypothetical protein